jgi:hypothetical protein
MFAVAQTTTTYEAPTGSVSPSLQVTMHLTGGGSVVLNPVVGPNCYLGMTCGFPSGYVGTSMSYTLPDGSTAQLANFNGKFFGVGSNNYEVSGQASGTDTQGRNVTVDDVQATMRIGCRSGRGGGCFKTYTGGSLTLTVTSCEGPCPTLTPTVTPSPTATSTPTQSHATSTPADTASTCVGSCTGEGDVTVSDLVQMVNIALGTAPLSSCPGVDARGSGKITIAEIVAAVNTLLNGCP